MKRLLQDVLSVGFSKFLMIVFGLSTSILIARVLGPEKSGVIAALLVYPSLFISFGSLGVKQSAAYFLGKKIFNEGEIKTAITQIWVFTSFLSMLFCFYIISSLSKVGADYRIVLLTISPIPFNLFNTYNIGIFLGKNDISAFSKIKWIPTLVVFLFTVVFVLALNLNIKGYLIALVCGPMIVSFILFNKNKFLTFFSLKFNWVIIKKMVSLGIVYALSLLVINLNLRLDVILLENLSSEFEIGIYSKGASIAEYLLQIPFLLSTIIFARGAIATNERLFSLKITKLLRLSIIIVFIASIVLVFVSEDLILVLFGSEFSESSKVLKMLVPGILFLTVFTVLNMDLAGKGKPWIAVKVMIPALLVNIILNFTLIPSYGSAGAAFSSTLSYFIAALLFLILYSRETRIEVKEIIMIKKTDLAIIKELIKEFKL